MEERRKVYNEDPLVFLWCKMLPQQANWTSIRAKDQSPLNPRCTSVLQL